MNKIKDFSPLVSIIIPVYNGSNYLKKAIDSALNQTYKNVEVIVVNDGSKDDGETEKIALAYGDKIRYLKKENGGVSTALNFGIREMKGEYFSWLSHDDEYEPEKIEKEVEALARFGDENSAVLCETVEIDKNSKIVKGKKKKKFLQKNAKNEWHQALAGMLKYGTYDGCAFLISKKRMEQCGPFHEGLRYCQDMLQWIKLFLVKTNLIYLDLPLCKRRIHNGQLSQTGRDIFYRDSLIISEIIIPRLIESPEYANKLLYSYAHHSAKMNNKKVVESCKKISKERKILSARQRVVIWMMGLYGGIRPFIRRVYFRLFRRVKTK